VYSSFYVGGPEGLTLVFHFISLCAGWVGWRVVDVAWHSVLVAASREYVHVRVAGHRNRARWPLETLLLVSAILAFPNIYRICLPAWVAADIVDAP
jgi:hypothetical protein